MNIVQTLFLSISASLPTYISWVITELYSFYFRRDLYLNNPNFVYIVLCGNLTLEMSLLKLDNLHLNGHFVYSSRNSLGFQSLIFSLLWFQKREISDHHNADWHIENHIWKTFLFKLLSHKSMQKTLIWFPVYDTFSN